MRMIRILFFILISFSINAQSSDQLIRLANIADLTALNAIANPIEGNIVYVLSEEEIYYYDGISWQTILPNTTNNNVWSLNGNLIGVFDFLGTTNNQDLRIRTNNQQRMVVKNNGNTGINTNEPTGVLEVNTNGDEIIPTLTSNSSSFVTVNGNTSTSFNDYWHAFDDLTTTSWSTTLSIPQSPAFLTIEFNSPEVVDGYRITAGGGNFSDPPYRFRLQASNNGVNWTDLENDQYINSWALNNPVEQTLYFSFSNNNAYKYYRFLILLSNSIGMSTPSGQIDYCKIKEFNLTASKSFIIKDNGNVGIGIENPSQKLHVNGDILASGTITPDYVFEQYFEGENKHKSDYKFMDIHKTMNFVQKHKHLPNVSSVHDIKKQGGIIVNNAVEQNLEKIEELYLHLYELQEKIKVLKRKIIEKNKTDH